VKYWNPTTKLHIPFDFKACQAPEDLADHFRRLGPLGTEHVPRKVARKARDIKSTQKEETAEEVLLTQPGFLQSLNRMSIAGSERYSEGRECH